MEDITKILQALALIQAAAQEVVEFMQNKQLQKGRTPQEILDHAKETNAAAKEIINNL